MNKTLLKPYTFARFDDLPVGTLFVRADPDTLSGLRPYQDLARFSGAEKVKFFGHRAFALQGTIKLDANHFEEVRPDETVMCGPHISARPSCVGYISSDAEAVLRQLLADPDLSVDIDDYYPDTKLSRKLLLLPSPELTKSHHVLGELVTHQAVELDGRYIRLTLPGLNRALQLQCP